MINKIELNISTQNGIEYFRFNALKLEGNNDVLLILVGYNGSINGYKNKYLKIAKRVNRIYGSTVFIIDNNECNWHSPKNYFRMILNYIINNMHNAEEIKIKLLGISAGAILAAYYAWEFPEISNILLVNPPLIKENLVLMIDGMKLFHGYSTLVIGKNDPVFNFVKELIFNKQLNNFKNVVLFDDADHNFKGLINEFINLPFQYLYNCKYLSPSPMT